MRNLVRKLRQNETECVSQSYLVDILFSLRMFGGTYLDLCLRWVSECCVVMRNGWHVSLRAHVIESNLSFSFLFIRNSSSFWLSTKFHVQVFMHPSKKDSNVLENTKQHEFQWYALPACSQHPCTDWSSSDLCHIPPFRPTPVTVPLLTPCPFRVSLWYFPSSSWHDTTWYASGTWPPARIAQVTL